MKNILFVLVAAFVLATGAHSAYAFNLGLNTDAKLDIRRTNEPAETENEPAEIEGRNPSIMANWAFSAGVTGVVTARNGSMLTVQGNNNVTYTIDASNAMIRSRAAVISLSNIAVGDTIFVQGAINGTTVIATTIVDAKTKNGMMQSSMMGGSGIIGTVTAASDTSITVLGKNGTTYTVDARDAKVWSNKKESTSLNTIATGDTVIVQGSASGDNINATAIYEVTLPQPSASAGIRGTVTAITGSTFTVLAADGKYYTVTTANAAVKTEHDAEAGLGSIKVGDSVVVKGDISGNTIDASTIIDMRLGKGFFSRFGLFFRNLFR